MNKNVIVVVMIAASGSATAATSVTAMPDFSPESVAVSTSLGMLAGESKEFVYDSDTGRKISQLNWKIKNNLILKGDVSWDVWPFLTLNARGWTTLSSGNGHMEDYDWQKGDQSHWTDRSRHPDTDLNYANEYDLNLKGWVLKGDTYKVGVMAGYQQTRFSWTAYGGSFNYDNGNDVGSFPNGARGIGYQQKYSMPYIGLTGQYRYQDFEFNAQFKFSDWVTAKDNDEHYMRDLTFREKSNDSRYYGLAVDAGYYVLPNTKVFAEFSYNKYEEGKSGTQMIDNAAGTSFSDEGDAAGLQNKNYTVTAGVQYRF
ncbi:omptin family outer membrane protease Cpa [Cronobacter turicensis]|nr:omptin family outer membrane protease [Cronobacter turicensis]